MLDTKCAMNIPIGKGHIIEFFGEAGVGKSQLLFSCAIWAVCDLKSTVLFFDPPRTFRGSRLAEIGHSRGDSDAVIAMTNSVKVCQPRTMRELLTLAEGAITRFASSKAHPVKLVILDDVCQLDPTRGQV